MPSRFASGERPARRPSSRRSVVPPADDRVLVGEILRPHGLRGEVKVAVHSDIEERFAVGKTLILVAPNGDAEPVRIGGFRWSQGVGLMLLEGWEGRDRAEALRGHRLEIDRHQVPEAPEGSYYYFDLVGCRCLDRQLGVLGEVEDLLEDGGGLLMSIRRAEGTVLLVPFVDAFLGEIDLEAKVIQVDLPAGLVETCESRS